MADEKTYKYIPRKEYSPGPNRRFRMVFLSNIGKNGEVFYVDMDSVDSVLGNRRNTLKEAYQQVRVVSEESEFGVRGVITVPIKGPPKILERVVRELEKQEMTRVRGEK